MSRAYFTFYHTSCLHSFDSKQLRSVYTLATVVLAKVISHTFLCVWCAKFGYAIKTDPRTNPPNRTSLQSCLTLHPRRRLLPAGRNFPLSRSLSPHRDPDGTDVGPLL